MRPFVQSSSQKPCVRLILDNPAPTESGTECNFLILRRHWTCVCAMNCFSDLLHWAGRVLWLIPGSWDSRASDILQYTRSVVFRCTAPLVPPHCDGAASSNMYILVSMKSPSLAARTDQECIRMYKLMSNACHPFQCHPCIVPQTSSKLWVRKDTKTRHRCHWHEHHIFITKLKFKIHKSCFSHQIPNNTKSAEKTRCRSTKAWNIWASLLRIRYITSEQS